MKFSKLIMNSNSGSSNNLNVYSYNIVAGSTAWYLNFEAKLESISNCPSSLSGLRVEVDNAAVSEQKLITYTKNTEIAMAGRLDMLVDKYADAATHKVTIDVYDESNTYLELRVAEITLNIIEAKKTNPVFSIPLNLG